LTENLPPKVNEIDGKLYVRGEYFTSRKEAEKELKNLETKRRVGTIYKFGNMFFIYRTI
jgi:hypothetical protein